MKRYSRISYRFAHNFSYKVCMNRHIFCFIFVHNFLWRTQKINRIVLIKSFAWIHVENGPCRKCEFINRGEWLCWILNWVWVGFMLNIDFCTVAWRQKWNRLENHRLITYSYFSTKLNGLDIGQLNNIIRIRMKFNKVIILNVYSSNWNSSKWITPPLYLTLIKGVEKNRQIRIKSHQVEEKFRIEFTFLVLVFLFPFLIRKFTSFFAFI